MLLTTTDYRRLFLQDVPLCDVRAPVEYSKGAFPCAHNLPLMNDIERQKVGTCYKQKGQQAAIQLGHQLVTGRVREQRMAAWIDFVRNNPQGYLYCFRGGLRSQTVQQWLKAEGFDYPRIAGGYKAMRTFLIETGYQAVQQCNFIVVGGMTGTGKTEVLMAMDNAIDLEGHANHRGSSFGKRVSVQPGQIDFENRLFIDFLKRRDRGQETFVLEDEARLIGRCALPLELHKGMQQFPLVWLEDSLESRVERILKDYVIDLCGEFISHYGEERGGELFAERMRESMGNIAKRLGGERYQGLSATLDEALATQRQTGSVELHRVWIERLLSEYYDPMYVYQRQSKSERILFSGNKGEIIDYLRNYRP